MKKNLITAVLAVAGVMPFALNAQAADGTIDFTGSIVSQTCKVGSGSGGNNFTVALPPVSTTALGAIGQTAGRTAFAIKLTDCSEDAGAIHTYFEPGPSVNVRTGGLIVDRGDDGASNVEIRLLNQNHSKITAGAADAAQNSQPVNVTAGSATLNYFAQYEAVGEVSAGNAKSRVQYTLVYE